jgi:dienelactone hydrolase
MCNPWHALLATFLVFPATAPVHARERLPGNAPSVFAVHSFKAANGETLRYSLYIPKDLPAGKRLPLVVCLHGSGGGTHAATVLADAEQQKKRPCFLLAPACEGKGNRWVQSEFRGGKGRAVEPELMATLDALVQKYAIDPTRIYLTGQSMGGVGTWGLIAAHPQRFAAAVPVCGLWNPADARKMLEVPIWAFHGARDNAVPVSGSRDMIEALRKVGGKPRYTEYPNLGHGVWGEAYATEELWEWVFAQKRPAYRIQLDTITKGFEGKPYDGKKCYTQARAGIVPRAGGAPRVVVTMSPLLLTGSDVYYELHEMRSDDLGKTWTGPIKHLDTLGRRPGGMLDGKPVEVVCGDFWPKWHAQSGKLLGTGHTVAYVDDKGTVPNRLIAPTYSVYDADKGVWSPWTTLDLPEGKLGQACGAGCTQRVDLPDGTILLPVYHREKDSRFARSTVLRCAFDGAKLKVLEIGDTLRRDFKRGLPEPSLAFYKGKFYLTLREEDAAYVAVSEDGLHFGDIRKWTWDDGTDLGSYNTQAHWVTHSDALYLVYTRKGANNDHVFRHRAPLFIAEVDTEKLQVKRATERILIPEKGARYGNFGVCNVSEHETWVVETEWMQRPPTEFVIPVDNQWGAEARVYAARILWDKPNQTWNQN